MIKAIVSDNAVKLYNYVFPGAMDKDQRLKDFIESISGKEIEIKFMHGNAYEINNSLYILPEILFRVIRPSGVTD